MCGKEEYDLADNSKGRLWIVLYFVVLKLHSGSMWHLASTCCPIEF